MDLNVLLPLLDSIKGCTFATLDSSCMVGSGKAIRCITVGERVIIYRTNGTSGYENKVKKHLAEAGKNPDLFTVGPLPWGERVQDLPLIRNNDKHYLQTIQLSPGEKKYFMGYTEVPLDPSLLSTFGVKPRNSDGQGLPRDKQVVVNTYDIENITRIVLMGEEVFDTKVAVERNILKIATPQPE